PLHRETDRAVVDAHPVAYLAAEQFIDRQSGSLARNVPQCHLDRADRTAPGLERAQTPDLQHDALDVGRVLADDQIAIKEHVRLEVRLVRLGLPIAVDPFVRGNPYDGIVADDRALDIRNLHHSPLV